jgi:hypothetical protein
MVSADRRNGDRCIDLEDKGTEPAILATIARLPSPSLLPCEKWSDDCCQSIWQTNSTLNRCNMQAVLPEAEYGSRLLLMLPVFMAVGNFAVALGILADAAILTELSTILMARALCLDGGRLVKVRGSSHQQLSQQSLRRSSGRTQMRTVGICAQGCHSFRYSWYSSLKPLRKPQSCYPNSQNHVNWTDRGEMLSPALTRLSASTLDPEEVIPCR